MLERVRNAVIPQGHYLGGIVSQLLRYVIFIPPFTFLLHRLQTEGDPRLSLGSLPCRLHTFTSHISCNLLPLYRLLSTFLPPKLV